MKQGFMPHLHAPLDFLVVPQLQAHLDEGGVSAGHPVPPGSHNTLRTLPLPW